jgi:arsenite-transporting ATPase
MPVAAVVANRCAAGQADRIAAALPGLPLLPLPDRTVEPVGVHDLAATGEALLGDDPLLTGSAAPAGPRVTRIPGPEGGFLLELALPVEDPGAVTLSRQGDDLVVEVGAHRRAIRLAPVLRRCTVRQARLADGLLTVGFQPDPGLWPAG